MGTNSHTQYALLMLTVLLTFLTGCVPRLEASNSIEDLAFQDNILWVCRGQQVDRINLSNDAIESFAILCKHLHVASNGWVWAQSPYGLAAYDGISWRKFTDPTKGSPKISDSAINYLSETSDGTIWVSSRQLARYNPQIDDWDIVIAAPPVPTPTPGPPPPAFCIRCAVSGPPGYIGPIFEAADKALWFNEHALGIVRWDKDSKQIWEERDGLSNLIPTVFIQARDGSIWVGTINGVNRFHDGIWQSWNFPGESGEDGEVLTILEDMQGRIWVSFESGLMVWNGSEWNEIGDFSSGYRKGEARSLFQASSGEVWICCYNEGIVKYDNGALTNYATHIVMLLETPDYRLFGGGREGLFIYNNQVDQWQPFPGK